MTDDISDLFIRTTKVLRDNLITELKNQNTFLKKMILKQQKKNPLKGKKVRILEHATFNGNVEESEGIFLEITSFSSSLILIKKNNKRKIKYISNEYIEFDETQFEGDEYFY